jgi:hypothetical protein
MFLANKWVKVKKLDKRFKKRWYLLNYIGWVKNLQRKFQV